MRRLILLVLMVSFCLVAACTPDPYGLEMVISHLERVICGPAVLQQQEPRPESAELVLFEGDPLPEGGIMFKPFALEGIATPRAFNEAVVARKVRYPEIFGLLARGALGEGADGRLVWRRDEMEATEAERQLVVTENRDRELMVQHILHEKGLPPIEAGSIRRIFGFVHLQLLPNGIWVERAPGAWIVKGGTDYEHRMMDHEPVSYEKPQETLAGEAPATTVPATTIVPATTTVPPEPTAVPVTTTVPPESTGSTEATTTVPPSEPPATSSGESKPPEIVEPQPTMR